MKFETPIYQDTFRRVFEFEDYNDFTNYWIEIDYFISRDKFVSRVNKVFADSPALNWDLTAENGLKIFRLLDNSNLTGRGYRLLNEKCEIANSTEDIYKVTELYGYAPSETFSIWTTETVSRCGVEDPEGAVTLNPNRPITYIQSEEKFTFPMQSQSDYDTLKVGDYIKLILYECYYNGTHYLKIETPFVPILEKAGLTICTQATGGFASNGEVSAYNFIQFSTMPRSFGVMRAVTKRAASSRTSATNNRITYMATAPASLETRFTPTAGGGVETDVITSATTPDIVLWKKIISGTATTAEIDSISGVTADGYMLVQNAEFEIRYNLYKKTLKFTRCV